MIVVLFSLMMVRVFSRMTVRLPSLVSLRSALTASSRFGPVSPAASLPAGLVAGSVAVFGCCCCCAGCWVFGVLVCWLLAGGLLSAGRVRVFVSLFVGGSLSVFGAAV